LSTRQTTVTSSTEATVSDFPRDEIEQAFVYYWVTGCVREDWDAWADCFVDDVEYVDHWWGPLHGRDEVKIWINAVMRGVPEIYTPLDWYVIEGDTVAFHMQNRRDNPDPDGPPYFDFPGVSVIWYAGDGKFRAEEDFWDLTGARRTTAAYVEACAKVGVTDPLDRMTRKHWPESPEWAHPEPGAVYTPSWFDTDVPGITRPSDLAALLTRDRP
jgi:ketosteroid isomerase-like protein